MENNGYGRWVWGIVIGDAIALIPVIWITCSSADWPNVLIVGLVGIATINGVILQVLTAGRMNEIMQRQEFETQKQRQAAEDALKRTDIVIEQNKSLIKAALRQAEASEETLLQASKHFALTERPVMGIEDFKLIDDTKHGPRFTAVIRNYGRATAYRMNARVSLTFLPHPSGKIPFFGECPEPDENPDLVWTGGGSIVPINAFVHARSQPLSPDQLEAWRNDTILIFALVKITYTRADKTEEFHYTGYYRCINETDIISCGDKYNDAN